MAGRGRVLAGAAALTALMPMPALAAASNALDETTMVALAVGTGAVALAIAAGLWALAEQNISARLRAALRGANARMRASASARDALIAAGREPLIVWGRDGSASHSYAGAEAILDSCLAGANATELSQAIDALSDRGVAFQLTAHDKNDKPVKLRGRAVGSMAAVWLEPEDTTAKESAPDFRAVLDVLPIPVWLRDKTLSLIWGNRAFAAAAGSSDAEFAAGLQTALDRSERDLAATARAEGRTTEAKRFAIMAGQRRALAFTHTPVEDGRIVGSAIDVTDVSNAEAKLQQHVDANADTLDKLATAVAIFGRDQKLNFYNRAFLRLWNLPDNWLDTHPTAGEILDRLREARRLPEQRDYQAWKRQWLAMFEAPSENHPEDLWHLPDGKTLRIVPQPHPFGGLTFLFEDVTEKLTLESSYNQLIKVQSATLDTLQEAVAVFGPDGRMKLHNAAFQRVWELEPAELSSEPHVSRIAQACIQRFGDEGEWQKLVAAISSGSARQRDWGEIERNDDSILSVSLAPLPDGATLVTFADVTDRFRIESALRDRNEALEAADQLKSDFVHHASFLFRDPLNAVRGFADMLATGVAGPLSEKQNEYVRDILSAAEKLSEVTSDILDLAMIDSGTMRLELARVDLYDLLQRVSEPLRQHSESLDITFMLDVRPDIGQVVVDPRRVSQIVFNLLSNAFRFTPREGRITLGANIVGDDVQIYVKDSGPGIAEEMKAQVFERFSAKSREGKRAGAGLGLALVNRFVELHDGWVEIESAPGRGTLVRAHLPRRLPEGAPPSDQRNVA
ncbi:MAG TPA: PAS-domain containing protein [Rhizomicrobium sp.]|nr:PAS-domain containing protein [Rhizomicrobium sp.]